MEEIKGDICHLEADVIVQQCNCVTQSSHGLSQQIEQTYPYVTLYSERKSPSLPGTCVWFEGKADQPIVACLLGQYYPGRSGRFSRGTKYGPALYGDDTPEQRLIWFQAALQELQAQLKNKDGWSVVFPYRIGCGLAGGAWNQYRPLLDHFTEDNRHLRVFLIHLT